MSRLKHGTPVYMTPIYVWNEGNKKEKVIRYFVNLYGLTGKIAEISYYPFLNNLPYRTYDRWEPIPSLTKIKSNDNPDI